MQTKKLRSKATLLLVFFLIATISGDVLGQTNPETALSQASTDTLQPYPRKLPSRSTWETIAYAPGWLVYAPLKYTLLGLGYLSTMDVDQSMYERIQDFLTSDDGRRGVLPTYSARGGGGLRFYQKDLFVEGAHFSLKATGSIDLRQRYQARMTGIPVFSESWTVNGLARYQLLTSESFFGIGPTSRVSDRTRYKYEQTIGHLSLCKTWTKSLKTRATLGYEHGGVMKSRESDFPAMPEMYTESVLPGVEERAVLAMTQIEIQFDNTNHSGYPSAGMTSELGSALYHDINSDRFEFWKISADLKRYIHLFYGRTLMLRITAEVTEPISDKHIPFTYLSELGGSTTIRGFMHGRFHDNDMLLGSLEYFYPIWEPMGRVVDAVIFTDFGQVSDDIVAHAALDDIQIGYGGGFRFYGRLGLAAKLEIGFSRETTRVYLKIN